jgi:hypothetical protein
LAVAAAACTTTEGEPSPDIGDSVEGEDHGGPVRLSPGDLWTNRGDAPIRARIEDERPIATEALERLAARLSVRTWPEMEEVPCTVVTSPMGADPPDDPYPFVELRPVSPLEARWYVFRADGLPADFSWVVYPGALPLADGTLGARFRPDSFPLLMDLHVCSAEGLRTRIGLDFSERVTADVPAADLVEVRNGSAEPAVCIVDEPPEVAVNCTGGLDVELSIEVSVAVGFRSEGGIPVRTLGSEGPWTFVLDWAALPCWGGVYCRIYRPE